MATNRNKGLGLSADTKNVEAERLQGERFLQLSQRCHEQNWGLVHSLAEQILSHRRETEEAAKRAREEVKCDINGNGENKAGDTVKDHDDVSARAISKHQHNETNNDLVHLKKQSNTLPLKRAAREGTVSISGKIVHIDSSAYAELGTGVDEINRTAGVGNAQNQGQIEVSNANASTVDAENFRSSNLEENSEISNINANPNSNYRNNATPIPQPKPLPYPAQPRMLSTCLGTASPLAWTCRYSAPSTTVKLVLDLEMSAVRRCLPQLGTPLHECVERPRPLRRTPLKRGRWSHVLDCALASQNIGSNATGTNEALANEHENPLTKNDATSNTENNASKSNPTQLKRPKGSNSKKRKRKIKLPKILRGLREWRRTVRTLIQADEALLKEDLANQNAQGGNGNGGRNDSTNANITDPSSEQKINSPQDLEFRGNRGRSRYPRSCLRNSNGPVSDNEKRNYPIRATLAQDADGNTPLHFMIRRAAAPACGGGRWQSRHEENEETDDDEDYGDFEEEEEIKKAHGENREKDEKDRGNEAGDTVMNDDRETNSAEGGDNANINASINGNDLRQIEYWGTSGSSWDGVRWCMEAHLRRVEHRIARQKLWDTCSDDDMSSKGVARGVASVCLNGSGSCNNTGDVDMMDIHEDETMDGPKKAVDSKYFPHISASSEQKLPTKRKTSGVEIDTQEDERSSRSSSTVHPLLPIEEINGKFRRKKYFDDDERQDCCFDPLLGAVCDLVYSCPEAVGVPDHREYEETPLIVALKSSVYVVMEPDDNFPLPGGDDIAMLGQGNLDGLGGGFANAVLGMEGGFPIPGLGALMPNRPFGFFPDDEAMMAVLRGHGRRLERNKRRVSQSNVAHANGGFGGFGHGFERRDHAGGCDDDSYSSVSDDDSFDGDGDPRYDAFVPSEAERLISSQNPPVAGSIIHRRRARYDYQTALEYRIFCLVRIMLGAYPRAACLMISDYTPLHSGVFHGRSTDTLRLLLDAEERFCESNRSRGEMGSLHAKSRDLQSSFEPCPLLPGPAMLCTNTRGELPLHFACMRNESARSIQLLAEADPRAALVRDASGRTPLHWLWIRFVDGLLDRFGGRDAQHDDAVNEAGEPVEIVHDVEHLEFQDQEAVNTRNFPRPNQTLNSTTMRDGDAFMNDVFNISNFEVKSKPHSEIFKFDTEYIRRTRMIDRTVDFLRMRHVPAGFENVENVAAEHAITVLLKLKYLQQRRQRQSDASSIQGAGSGSTLSPEVTMSIKEEFILLAFKKFTSLIYAAFVASGAEKTDNLVDSVRKKQKTRKDGDIAYSDLDEPMASSKMLWNSLAQARVNDTTNFYLLHEACGAPRSSCPPAIARICIKLYSDQLFQFDDDGRLPLHRAAMRDLGWDPPLGNDAPLSVLRNETMVLLNDVLEASHPMAPRTFDRHRQLPLHCAIDSLVASLLCGKCRRASMHAEARVAMQKHRHAQVEISIEFLSLLLRINSSALERRDGKSRLFPFMQAATIRADGNKVVKYSTDLSRRPGFNIGNASFENEIVEEDDRESDSDHLTIIYYLFRENPSIINSLV